MRLPTFLSERLGSLKSRKGLTSRLAADGETPAAIAATVAAALAAAAASEDVRGFIGAIDEGIFPVNSCYVVSQLICNVRIQYLLPRESKIRPSKLIIYGGQMNIRNT